MRSDANSVNTAAVWIPKNAYHNILRFSFDEFAQDCCSVAGCSAAGIICLIREHHWSFLGIHCLFDCLLCWNYVG
jgi:hypothetical protein